MSMDMYWQVYTNVENPTLQEQIDAWEYLSEDLFARGAWHIHYWINKNAQKNLGNGYFLLDLKNVKDFLQACQFAQLNPEQAESFLPGTDTMNSNNRLYFKYIDELVTLLSELLREFSFKHHYLVYRAHW